MTMSNPSHSDDHGHSWPAWATVILVAIGTLISAFSFPLHAPAMFWTGVGVIVLAVVVGNVWHRSRGGAMASYTETEPAQTSLEGPTRSASGTNRP